MPLSRYRHFWPVAAAISLSVLVAVASCQDELPTTPRRAAASGDAPIDTTSTPLYFTPVDSPSGFSPAVAESLSLPVAGDINDSAQLLPAGAGSGGVVVKVLGTITVAGHAVPIGEVLNAGGVLSYATAMATAPGLRPSSPRPDGGSIDLVVYQPLRLQFIATTPDSDILIPSAQGLDGNLNVAYLRLNGLGAYPLRLVWSFVSNAGFSLGSVSQFTDSGCVPIYDHCVPLPSGDRVSQETAAVGAMTVQVLVPPAGHLGLSLARNEVLPVWAHQFNAVTQYTFDPDPRERTGGTHSGSTSGRRRAAPHVEAAPSGLFPAP